MADVNFIKRLFEFDKEHIKEDTLKKIKKYIDHKDFVPAVSSNNLITSPQTPTISLIIPPLEIRKGLESCEIC